MAFHKPSMNPIKGIESFGDVGWRRLKLLGNPIKGIESPSVGSNPPALLVMNPIKGIEREFKAKLKQIMVKYGNPIKGIER